jgi:predicted phosphodiesterase
MESDESDGILHLNPGSAGPKRFGRPRTLARLIIVAADEGEGLAGEDPPARIRVELLAADEGH